MCSCLGSFAAGSQLVLQLVHQGPALLQLTNQGLKASS